MGSSYKRQCSVSSDIDLFIHISRSPQLKSSPTTHPKATSGSFTRLGRIRILKRCPLRSLRGREIPIIGAPPRILVGVPSQGALLKFCLNLKFLHFSSHEKGGSMQSTKQGPLAWQGCITTSRSPGIPEGAVYDRLTHWHSSHGHGTHIVGLGIVFQGLLL